jgi:hypothetical protein
VDLGTCPKCGRQWEVGAERCQGCRFVATGAGLRGLYKKKKKRRVRFVEPGSWTPVLVILGLAIGGLAVWSKPWTDDFAKLKSLVGMSAHPFSGDFKLLSAAKLNQKSKSLLAERGKQGVLIRFYKDGRVVFLSEESETKSLLKCRYRIERNQIELYAIKSTNKLPNDDVKFKFESLSGSKYHLERPEKELWVIQKLTSADNLERKWSQLFTSIEKEMASEKENLP